MTFEHECLGCGVRFTGRPNKLFCSARCKDRQKYRRRRAREIETRIEHTARQAEVARLRGNRGLVHMHEYRERLLREELDSLSEKVQERG